MSAFCVFFRIDFDIFWRVPRLCFLKKKLIWASFRSQYILFVQFQILKAYPRGFGDIALLIYWQKHLKRIFWFEMQCWNLFFARCKALQSHKLNFLNIQAINFLSYRSPFASQSRRRRVWNQGKALYGIGSKSRMELRRSRVWNQADGDARWRVMPYTSSTWFHTVAMRRMPCQASSAWIKQKRVALLLSFVFGDPSGNRTRVSSVRG